MKRCERKKSSLVGVIYRWCLPHVTWDSWGQLQCQALPAARVALYVPGSFTCMGIFLYTLR